MRLGNGSRFLPVVAVLALCVAVPLADAAQAGPACEIDFKLDRGSPVYKNFHGTGMLTCDNGQSAEVRVRFAGRAEEFDEESSGVEVRASFSRVGTMRELFGTYTSTDDTHQGGDGSTIMFKGTTALFIGSEVSRSSIEFIFGFHAT